MGTQLKRYILSGSAQFVSAFAAEVVSLAPPALFSTRAQAINVATGQAYYLKNANTTDTIPASITKMMTVYTLLQHKTYAQLEQTVTVVSSDLQIGSGANLLAGDIISYRQLIANAILPSSNTSCAVIARAIGQGLLDIESGGVGDSFARFMTEMNGVSDAIGMTGSTWYNPAGLNGTDYTPVTATNITNPSDINIVMGALWQYPVMPEIWVDGAQLYTMPLVRSGSATTITIENVNELRADVGVIGGKTGTSTVANASVLWKSPSQDVVAITVFNGGSTGRYTDVRAIIAQVPLDFPELSYPPSYHLVTGLISSQSNITSQAAIKQTHLVNASSSVQSNVATAASISADGTVLVTASNSTQANSGVQGAIQQTHMIICAASVQDNIAAASIIVQMHLIGASNSTQTNVDSVVDIRQTHFIGVTSSTQPVATSDAIVSQDLSVLLVADAVTQPVTSSPAAITQTHMLVCAPVAVDSVASASTVVQTHLVGVADSIQGNRSSTASASNVVFGTDSGVIFSISGPVRDFNLLPADPVVFSLHPGVGSI